MTPLMSGSFGVFLLRRAVGVVVVSVVVSALTFVTIHGLSPQSFPGSRSLPIGLVAPSTYVGFTRDSLTWLHSLLVPWLVAGAPLAGMCLRMTRATLPEAMEADFVRTATAKGLSPARVTARHTLPVALAPTLSLAGACLPLLVGNIVLVEAVFGIPGLYRLIPGALDNGNFPVLQGIVIVGSVFVVVANAIVDGTLAALDPRVRSA
jgi:peptide/nickel transport system permease protein